MKKKEVVILKLMLWMKVSVNIGDDNWLNFTKGRLGSKK